MARRDGTKKIGAQFTEAEYVALTNFAHTHNLDKSVVIRAALAVFIENFPTDEWTQDVRWHKRGKFEFKCPVVKKS